MVRVSPGSWQGCSFQTRKTKKEIRERNLIIRCCSHRKTSWEYICINTIKKKKEKFLLCNWAYSLNHAALKQLFRHVWSQTHKHNSTQVAPTRHRHESKFLSWHTQTSQCLPTNTRVALWNQGIRKKIQYLLDQTTCALEYHNKALTLKRAFGLTV